MCVVSLFAVQVSPISADAATVGGAVSSVANVDSGIKVKWNRSKGKSGYYIYRKQNSSKTWKKVKTIKGASTVSWIDTGVKNGNKYFYRVYPFKASKIYKNSVYKKMYRLKKAVISSSSYADVGGFCIISAENAYTSGYQIKYSKSSSFSSYKTIKVYGIKTLRKAVSGLTQNCRYYVRIRAYKKLKDGTYYGPYSKTKVFTTLKPYARYTSNLYTSVYDKPDSDSKKTTLYYMSRVVLYQDVAVYAKGRYKKLKYNGKIYYTWIPAGISKFTRTKNPYTYTDGVNTKYQRAVVDTALKYFRKDTDYCHDESTGKDEDGNGKVGFDCSGFVSCVFNEVMQGEGFMTYKLDKNIIKIHDPKNGVCNDGYDCEIAPKVVCKGTIDYSVLKPGDVLFFDMPGAADTGKAWNHCGIYLGNKQFVHATRAINGVTVWPIQESFITGFDCAIRFLPYQSAEFEKINKTFVTEKTRKIYPDIRCTYGSHVDTVSVGEEITIICTKKNDGFDVAYVEYGDGQNGFIFQPPVVK